jgi:hypothetical protein
MEEAMKKPTTEEIEALLGQLKAAEDSHEAIVLYRNKLKEDVITPEQRQQLADIDAEMKPQLDAAYKEVESRMEEIKRLVVQLESSVSTGDYQVSYVKPSTKWNTDMLVGLAQAVPGIYAAMSTGAASSRITRRKKVAEEG